MSHAHDWPLGYRSAKRVVELGRAAFFGSATFDLPAGRSLAVASDDCIPQFGYVGRMFTRTRVLLLGINPGNGNDFARSPRDEAMMPALYRFASAPTPRLFLEAQDACKAVCQSWSVWRRHCSEVIGAGKLSFEDVAYSNCLPWRTESLSGFDDRVGERAVASYAYPLIEELQPRVIVAMGEKVARILALGGRRHDNLVVWNRAQAATISVREERKAAATQILRMVGRIQE